VITREKAKQGQLEEVCTVLVKIEEDKSPNAANVLTQKNNYI
jgi:hypothetical protein